MVNDIEPRRDGSDSFLHPGEEQHYTSGTLKMPSSRPGEEHYYGSGKLKAKCSFDRRDVWKISTVVLAGIVALLLVNTARQATHVQPAHSKEKGHTTISSVSGASQSVLTAGSIWQGTFNQHDYHGLSQTAMIVRIDSVRGNTFFGTTTEIDFDRAVTTAQGTIVDDISKLGYTDRERFQTLINKYANAGTLIMFTNPEQLNGNNIVLHSRAYALVTQDGILHGIDFDPDHDPINLRSDGDFTLYLD
jgi:hypothetical protein